MTTKDAIAAAKQTEPHPMRLGARILVPAIRLVHRESRAKVRADAVDESGPKPNSAHIMEVDRWLYLSAYDLDGESP